MSDILDCQASYAIEHTIVPYPQREAWAVVNRRGDVLAVGGYGDCLREMGRLATPNA